MGHINVANIGVGNCASSLIQGVQHHRNAQPGDSIPGLMPIDLGGYHVRDINVADAFDIDQHKARKDFSETIFRIARTPPVC